MSAQAAMPDETFWEDQSDAAPVSAPQPTAEDPLRGLRHLSAVAVVGRKRLAALAAAPVTYAWQDIAVAGTIVLLAAGPSEGKTTLLFLILVARANVSALPAWLLEREIRPAPRGKYIVLIEGEHAEASAARKLIGSAQILKIDEGCLDRIIMIARKAVRLGSPEWEDVVRLIAAGLVSDVAIDTVARVAPGDADDERSQVAIFDQVAQAIEAAPSEADRPTVWCCAHTRKNNSSTAELADVSGSTQRTGQADSVLILKGDKVDGRTASTRVVFAKLREEPDEYPAPVTYAIEKDEHGVRRYRAVGEDDGEASGQPLETRILEKLRAGPKTKNELSTALGRSYTALEPAITNLFASRSIRGVNVTRRNREYKAFALRSETPSRSPDSSPDSASPDESSD